MREIEEQVDELKEVWKLVFESSTEAIVQAHLPNISLAQINEVANVAFDYLSGIRVPEGFSPTFQLAKAVAATTWIQQFLRQEEF